MKAKSGRILLSAVIAAALILSMGRLAPVSAEEEKRPLKRHVRMVPIDRDSESTPAPVPIVDDAPINPNSADAVNRADDSSENREPQKPQRKLRRERHRD